MSLIIDIKMEKLRNLQFIVHVYLYNSVFLMVENKRSSKDKSKKCYERI